MIKFLVTAAIVLICLFILVLVSCLMVWVVMRLLRWLFPISSRERQVRRKCDSGQLLVLMA